MKPYCFVLMPFGQKKDESGKVVEFDEIYDQVIHPAVESADLSPIRADEELAGGIIHKPMFERLMLCDYAVADLTTANANVFYELGVRHGIRPHSTVLMFAKGMRLPFDVAPLRALAYELTSTGNPYAVDDVRAELKKRLEQCRDPQEDSPLFQLIADCPRPDISRLKTDTFRDLIEYSSKYKAKLKTARLSGANAVRDVERELNIRDADPAIIIDLFLSYRAVKDWQGMVDLVGRMPQLVARTVLVREQFGLALNRLARRKEAEAVLRELLDERGYSSETNGILGRVYKDMWEDEKAAGNATTAKGYLRKATETYLAGFEADWRDAYPGINAVTLMELQDPPDSRQQELLPVVEYAVKRRLSQRSPDYWDYATLLEISVLRREQE